MPPALNICCSIYSFLRANQPHPVDEIAPDCEQLPGDFYNEGSMCRTVLPQGRPNILLKIGVEHKKAHSIFLFIRFSNHKMKKMNWFRNTFLQHPLIKGCGIQVILVQLIFAVELFKKKQSSIGYILNGTKRLFAVFPLATNQFLKLDQGQVFYINYVIT